MTKKIFIGALVAITLAGTVSAMAQSTGANNGGKGGFGGGIGRGSGGEVAAIIIRPSTPNRLPRKYKKPERCGCVVAIVRDSYGDVRRRSCNKPAHFNDTIIEYSCGR
ncbi:MAG: hypothetical protein V3V02_02865 [Rhizobiaceae bacterium]